MAQVSRHEMFVVVIVLHQFRGESVGSNKLAAGRTQQFDGAQSEGGGQGAGSGWYSWQGLSGV
jgi:hypothetical protein